VSKRSLIEQKIHYLLVLPFPSGPFCDIRTRAFDAKTACRGLTAVGYIGNEHTKVRHGEPETSTEQSLEGASGATSGLQALADLLASLPEVAPHRRYVLERVDGELVFRQPEIDAIVDDAISKAFGEAVSGRHIIKLP
jgi:hypothetical protein